MKRQGQRRGAYSYRIYPEGAYNERAKTDSWLHAQWVAWYLGMRELWRWITSGFKCLPRRTCIYVRHYKEEGQ